MRFTFLAVLSLFVSIIPFTANSQKKQTDTTTTEKKVVKTHPKTITKSVAKTEAVATKPTEKSINKKALVDSTQKKAATKSIQKTISNKAATSTKSHANSTSKTIDKTATVSPTEVPQCDIVEVPYTPGKIPVGYKTTWVVNPYDTVTIYTQGKHNYKIGTFYWLGLVTNGEHLRYELWNKKKRYSSVIAAKAIKLVPVYND